MRDFNELVLEGATPSREGFFSLALEKAQEKLKRFQLPDPRHYILQLIQAVAAGGATSVVIDAQRELGSPTVLTLRFDGPGYTRDEFERMTHHLFLSGKERSYDRLRELALGLLSCQGLAPRSIEVHCRDYAYRWKSGQVTGEVVQATPTVQNQLTVVGRRDLSELELVEQYCKNCSIPLHIGDKRVNQDPKYLPPSPWPNFQFEEPGLRGSVGLGYTEQDKSSIIFLRYGVQFCKRWEERLQPPVVVTVESTQVRKNASQTDVVEDQLYAECLDQLQQMVVKMADDLAGGRVPAYQRDIVDSFLLASFSSWLDHSTMRKQYELPEATQRLLKYRMFRGLDGRHYALTHLAEQYESEGYLSVVTQTYPYADLGDWKVFVVTDNQLSALRRVFPRCRFVDGLVKASMRTGGFTRPDVFTESLHDNEFLVKHEFSSTEAHGLAWLGLTKHYPSGKATLFTPTQGGMRAAEYRLEGLTLSGQFKSTVTRSQQVQYALATMQSSAADIYEQLIREQEAKLVEAPVRDPVRTSAMQHVVAYFRWLLKEAGAQQLRDELPSVLSARLDQHYKKPYFCTRAGGRFSLADLVTWLALRDYVVTSFGSQPLVEDHAIELYGEEERFLAWLFGSERFRHATPGEPLAGQRQLQKLLPQAQAHSPESLRAAIAEATVDKEDEELAQLQSELEELLAIREPEPEPAQPGQPIPRAEAITLSPAELRGQNQEVTEEATPESPLDRVQARFRDLGKEEIHRREFQHAEAEGLLILTVAREVSVLLFHEGREAGFWENYPNLQGWVDTQLEAEELAEVLEREVEELYREAATSVSLEALDSPRRCRAFLAYLRRTHRLMPQRLADSHPLCSLPLIPLLSGQRCSLNSLRQVAQEKGKLPIWRTEVRAPVFFNPGYPVAAVGVQISENALRELLGVELEFLDASVEEKTAGADDLLRALREELLTTGGRSDLDFLMSFFTDFRYGKPVHFLKFWENYFIHYDTERRIAELNPKHPAIQKIIDELAQQQRCSIPVLASSIFSAANRELEQVADHHEFDFLQALLEIHQHE